MRGASYGYASRFIVIAGQSTARGQILWWQQCRLYASGQFEILFQCTLIEVGKRIRAESHKGVCHQTLVLDRFLAFFAGGKRALFYPVQDASTFRRSLPGRNGPVSPRILNLES
jgi:hypothetical protein